MVVYWHGYLSWARCRFAYGPAELPLPLTVSCSSKSRLVLPFWYWLTRIVLDKGLLNRCCFCHTYLLLLLLLQPFYGPPGLCVGLPGWASIRKVKPERQNLLNYIALVNSPTFKISLLSVQVYYFLIILFLSLFLLKKIWMLVCRSRCMTLVLVSRPKWQGFGLHLELKQTLRSCTLVIF